MKGWLNLQATLFRPKLLDTLNNYNSYRFGKEVLAGISVGVPPYARKKENPA